MDGGGVINIDVIDENDNVLIIVTDNGIGFDSETESNSMTEDLPLSTKLIGASD